MKKLIIIIISILILIFLSKIPSIFNNMIKRNTEQKLTALSQVAVTLDKAFISPFTGKGTLYNFQIDNPQGYQTKRAFNLDIVEIDLNLKSIFSNCLKINRIEIFNSLITFEKNNQGHNNIEQIADNIKSQIKKDASSQDDNRKIMIKSFIINKGLIQISKKTLDGTALLVPLNLVFIDNLGTETGGITVKEAANIISEKLFDAVISSLMNTSKTLLKEGVNATGKAVGKGTKYAGKSAVKGFKFVGRSTVKGLKGIKNIFSRNPSTTSPSSAKTFPAQNEVIASETKKPVEFSVNEKEIDEATMNKKIGDNLFKSKRYLDAIKYYKMTTEINPNRHDAYFEMGRINYRLRKFQLAVEHYSKAILLAPDNIRYLSHRLKAWKVIGNINAMQLDQQQIRNIRSKQ